MTGVILFTGAGVFVPVGVFTGVLIGGSTTGKCTGAGVFVPVGGVGVPGATGCPLDGVPPVAIVPAAPAVPPTGLVGVVEVDVLL